MFCSCFSTWSRSRDKIELESSGLAADDPAEKEHPEYSRELEALCEELQATLESLVRGRPLPGAGCAQAPSVIPHCPWPGFSPSSASPLVSRSACPTNLVSEMLS